MTTILLFIITSALHIYYLTQREHLDFQGALVHGIGSTIVFCLSVIVIWPVTALLSYHMRVNILPTYLIPHFADEFFIQLLLLNVTTIEQVSCPHICRLITCLTPLLDP